MPEIRVPLAETVRVLRQELERATAEGDGKGVRFALGPVELEFQVEVTWEGGVDSGVRFYVISAGAKASRSSASTHTVKLTLMPIGADGEDVKIASAVGEQPE